jgi:hypothetical protein
MALDEPQAGEVPTSVNGIGVLISDDVKALAEKSKIDYISDSYRKGFTIGLVGQGSC